MSLFFLQAQDCKENIQKWVLLWKRCLKVVTAWTITIADLSAVRLLSRHRSVPFRSLAFSRICANKASLATLLTQVNILTTPDENISTLRHMFWCRFVQSWSSPFSKFSCHRCFRRFFQIGFSSSFAVQYSNYVFSPSHFVFSSTTNFLAISSYSPTPRYFCKILFCRYSRFYYNVCLCWPGTSCVFFRTHLFHLFRIKSFSSSSCSTNT